MKKHKFRNSLRIVARKSQKARHLLDYYLVTKSGRSYYAFTRHYTNGCFNLCRSEVPVTTVLTVRGNNKSVMDLKQYL